MKPVAIHWNGMGLGPVQAYEQQFLSPTAFEGKRPYYGKRVGVSVTVNANTQEVVDSDITFAALGGLEAFMYLPYPTEPNWLVQGKGSEPVDFCEGMNGGYKLYQTSSKKSMLKHCVLAEGYRCYWSGQTGPGPGATAWNEFAEAYVRKFFTQPNYLTFGGRPVWGILDCAAFQTYIGSNDGDFTLAQQRIAYVRTYAQSLGLGNPYIVCLDSNTGSGAAIGCDAFSDYATQYGNVSNSEYPYSTLTAIAQAKWTADKNASRKVIPHITAGWDFRPRMGYGSPYVGSENNPASWIKNPSTAEFMAHYTAANAFIVANPTACESGLAIIYAWNENTEGGYIMPHAGDNYGDRLRAIAAFQGAPGLPPAQIAMPFSSLQRVV